MAQCYHRKIAYLVEGEALYFKPPAKKHTRISIPCGKCLACRVNKSAEWATRAMHESLYCDTGCFVTLTYDPEHCPSDYSLRKSDLQKFVKRLRITLQRKNLGAVRAFFACGEYGTKRGRPHYHILLLGWCPSDMQYFAQSYSGMPLYTSKLLEQIWGKGFCPCGTVTGGSAGYVARYSKKGMADNSGHRLKPFFLVSRNIPIFDDSGFKICCGSLGAQWVRDNHKSLRLGYVTHPSKPTVKCKIPDYYFDLLERWFPDEYAVLRDLRYKTALDHTNGFMIFDDNGVPNVCAYDDLGGIDDYKLSELLGVDTTSLHGEEILSLLRDNIIKQSAEQERRLNNLKRNYE